MNMHASPMRRVFYHSVYRHKRLKLTKAAHGDPNLFTANGLRASRPLLSSSKPEDVHAHLSLGLIRQQSLFPFSDISLRYGFRHQRSNLHLVSGVQP